MSAASASVLARCPVQTKTETDACAGIAESPARTTPTAKALRENPLCPITTYSLFEVRKQTQTPTPSLIARFFRKCEAKIRHRNYMVFNLVQCTMSLTAVRYLFLPPFSAVHKAAVARKNSFTHSSDRRAKVVHLGRFR